MKTIKEFSIKNEIEYGYSVLESPPEGIKHTNNGKTLHIGNKTVELPDKLANKVPVYYIIQTRDERLWWSFEFGFDLYERGNPNTCWTGYQRKSHKTFDEAFTTIDEILKGKEWRISLEEPMPIVFL